MHISAGFYRRCCHRLFAYLHKWRRYILAIACVFILPIPSAAQSTIYWLDMRGMSYNQQVATLALEGIVNRNGPHFMVDSHSIFWEWPPADEHWRQYYAGKGFQFKELPSLDAAIVHFRPDLHGIILYDPTLDASRYIACTMAGLHDAIPIPASMRTGAFSQLPVMANLQNRWSTDEGAYRWAIKNLLPLCAKDVAFSAGRTHLGTQLGGDFSIVLALDYAVYRRAFCFNLSPAANPEKFSSVRVPGYPIQAHLFDEILSELHHPVAVFGWAEPESVFVRHVSRDGGYVECAAAPNLSFQAAVGTAYPTLRNGGNNRPFHLPSATATELRPDAYVAFVANERDTPEIAASWQSGAWFDPNRGQLPISWGFSAILAQDFPALYHAFVSTATTNDGLYSNVSGGGYVTLNDVSDLDAYATETGTALKRAGETVAEVMEFGYHPNLLEKYVQISGVQGISHWLCPGYVGAKYLKDGTPVIFPDDSLFYYSPTPPADFAQKLHLLASTMPRPCFIEVYGGLNPKFNNTYGGSGINFLGAPTWYKAVAADLGDGFQVVRLDTMIQLARQAGKLSVESAPSALLVSSPTQITVALRNPSDKPVPTRLEWGVPEGWNVTTMDKIPNQLPAHSTSQVRLQLSRSPGAVGGKLTLQDVKRNLVYQLPLCAANLIWKNNCNNPGQWLPWFKPNQTATVSLSGTGLVLQCPSDQPFAAAELSFSANFNGPPLWVEIKVTRATHLWSFKIRPANSDTDIYLVHDTSQVGTFRINLSKKTRWLGRMDFRISVFAIGPGQKVFPTRIKLFRCAE